MIIEKTKRFSCILPAPNPTGKLHMGHILNLSIQDLLCRWHALTGYSIYWPSALDHGGISTQFVVEKKLRKRGIKPEELSKTEISEQIASWRKDISYHIIENQMKKMNIMMDFDSGGVIDDEVYSQHIDDLFAQLFHKQLVYKDQAIHNWCASCRTSLGDMEIIPKEESVDFYCIRYAIEGLNNTFIEVTTRSITTMPGDVAIAVNKHDGKFFHLKGRLAICPITGKRLPIIKEDYIDSKFESGAARVTPGVNAQDYLVAKKRGYKIIPVYDEQGRFIYTNKNQQQLDSHYLSILDEKNSLVHKKSILRGNAYCRYCNSKCISRESSGWYLKISSLVSGGRSALKNGDVTIYPKHYTSVCDEWMAGLSADLSADLNKPKKWWDGHCMAVQKSLASNSDWCISRNLNNGNRIPICQCDNCGEFQIIGKSNCKNCNGRIFTAETQVMDMWLSCALWCFAQNKIYTDVTITDSLTVTGYDLLYLWVSTTIMLGSVLNEKIPFDKVVIHPVIGDSHGRKMSKSLGNTLIPDEIIDQYGCDTLRLSLLSSLSLDSEMIKFSNSNLIFSENMKNDVFKIFNDFFSVHEITPEEMDLYKDISRHPLYLKLNNHINSFNISAYISDLYDFTINELKHGEFKKSDSSGKEIYNLTLILFSIVMPSILNIEKNTMSPA
jgi:valyl-tRNA synthetase